VSLVLDEPIVLRPPSPPQSVLTIDDLVAPRPKALTSPPGVTCTQQFQEDVAFIVHGIAEQYGKILKDASVGGSDADAKRKALMTALNTSGQYHAMKERLKRSAVRIVRERFHKTELQTEDEYVAAKDAFLADLYTYLIGQAHRAMHDAFEEAATGAAITRAGSVKGSITAAIMSSASKPDSRSRNPRMPQMKVTALRR
jgi:cell division protein ZapA (FtsZ GTPase activity inhibitor)